MTARATVTPEAMMVGQGTKIKTAAVVMVDVHNSSARRQRGGEDEAGMITEATTEA